MFDAIMDMLEEEILIAVVIDDGSLWMVELVKL